MLIGRNRAYGDAAYTPFIKHDIVKITAGHGAPPCFMYVISFLLRTEEFLKGLYPVVCGGGVSVVFKYARSIRRIKEPVLVDVTDGFQLCCDSVASGGYLCIETQYLGGPSVQDGQQIVEHADDDMVAVGYRLAQRTAPACSRQLQAGAVRCGFSSAAVRIPSVRRLLP